SWSLLIRPCSSRNWPRNLTAMRGVPVRVWEVVSGVPCRNRAASGDGFAQHAEHRLGVDGLLQIGRGAHAQAFLDVALGAERRQDHDLCLRIVGEDLAQGLLAV